MRLGWSVRPVFLILRAGFDRPGGLFPAGIALRGAAATMRDRQGVAPPGLNRHGRLPGEVGDAYYSARRLLPTQSALRRAWPIGRTSA